MKKPLESDRTPLVAIVDDDDSQRRSARMLVSSFGFRSEAFARPKDFLTWTRRDEVSCLILDVLMPDMNGLQVQRHLSRTRPGLPIIFISARAKEHEERQAMNAGAVAVLRKPVADDILLNTIRRALNPRIGPPGADSGRRAIHAV